VNAGKSTSSRGGNEARRSRRLPPTVRPRTLAAYEKGRIQSIFNVPVAYESEGLAGTLRPPNQSVDKKVGHFSYNSGLAAWEICARGTNEHQLMRQACLL